MSFPHQNYVEQFEIFVDQISHGILVYNEEDLEVKRVAAATKPTRKLAYTTPNYKVENNFIRNSEGDMPIEVLVS
jgi:UDP-N-acetylmuramate: L-alanyl-gamma-D-glutamyl-meso-diaminopimelate ligase